jgi:hypothetical protein
MGYAMRRRWDWLQDALERGIEYRAAEAAFDAAVDRERGADAAMGGEPNARAARRAQRAGQAPDADALFAHADAAIPPPASVETFADLRVL